MPQYAYLCECGLRFDRYLSYANYDNPQACECGRIAQRQICAPLMVAVAQNICYDSPITGKPITSMSERREDLARHHCQPYDPEMKKDAERFRRDAEEKLFSSVDETVEREIATMPSRKRERLENEMSAGLTAEVVRQGA